MTAPTTLKFRAVVRTAANATNVKLYATWTNSLLNSTTTKRIVCFEFSGTSENCIKFNALVNKTLKKNNTATSIRISKSNRFDYISYMRGDCVIA